MPLRPLDNAQLPAAAAERPKKMPKLSAPAAEAAVAAAAAAGGKNDENSAPPPAKATAEQAVEYVPSEGLQALPNPKAKISNLVAELDSKDWIKACEVLNDARRLALHHSSLLLPVLEKVILGIAKAMKSPRSAVCKTSIMACADIFAAFGHLLLSSGDEAFDKLLLQLLLKASQDKRFVCEEAEKAMRAMAMCVPPLPLLRKLKCYVSHANLRVRAKAAVAISNCASRMEIDGMEEFGLSALLQVAAELLNDRLPEAREAARSIINSMHAAFSKGAAATGLDGEPSSSAATDASWESLCSLSLPPISAQAVAKITSQ